MIAVAGADQLCGDAQPVTRLAHRSLEQRRHAEQGADLARILLAPAERQRGSARGHQKSGDTCEQRPSTASQVSTHQIPALVAELASEQATLSALQGVLTARLLASHDHAETTKSADRLLTAEQVATTLGVTKRWVERRARRLPLRQAPLSARRALFGSGTQTVDVESADANWLSRCTVLRRAVPLSTELANL
jgi:hypothetical protein